MLTGLIERPGMNPFPDTETDTERRLSGDPKPAQNNSETLDLILYDTTMTTEFDPPDPDATAPTPATTSLHRHLRGLKGGREALEWEALDAIMTGEEAGLAHASALIEKLATRAKLEQVLPSTLTDGQEEGVTGERPDSSQEEQGEDV